MKTSQVNAILAGLAEVREAVRQLRPTIPTVPTVTGRPYFVDAAFPAPEKPVEPLKGSELAAVKRATLQAVLDALDGWIEGAHENHGALQHRGEPVGDECWRRFHPQDIRRMVDDAARNVGLTSPMETAGVPKEDVVGL